MSCFNDRIDLSISHETFIGNVVYREYAVTSNNQEVGFVVTSVFWYALRVFFDESHTNGDLEPVYHTEHWTLDGAKNQIKKFVEQLSRKPPYFVCPLHNFTNDEICKDCVCRVELSKECSDNPDKFLQPGDHISVSRGLYRHDAIYAGNRMVYQISPGESDSKSAKATTHAKFDLWENFTLNKHGKICVIVHRIRRRTPQEILDAARQFCNSCYGQGSYNFWMNNCQNFAAKCCTGFKWSYEAYQQPTPTHVNFL